MTIHEDEAQVFHQATKAVLAGQALAAVAHELRERGATGTLGKPITYTNLRDTLIRPRNVGIFAKGLPNRSSTPNSTTRTYEEIVERQH